MMERLKNNRKQHVVGILCVTILLAITWFISQHHVQGKTEKVAVISGEFYLNKKGCTELYNQMTKLAQSALDKSKFNLVISRSKIL